MRISIVIPVYNVEGFLVRCLDSVEDAARHFASAGGGRAVEIVCVDDGSTDSSPDILADWVARHPDAGGVSRAVVTKENGGLASARNAGLDRVTGDWVLFVDSDDYIPPHAVSTFADVAAAAGVALVVSTSFLKDCGKGVSAAPPPHSPVWRVRPAAWLAGRKVQYSAWNKFYRADLLKSRRFPTSMRAFEDYPFVTKLLCDVETIATVDCPLYVYCVNPSATSIVHSPYTERKLADSMVGIRAILSHAKVTPAWEFGLRQAADGLNSTIGKIFKTKNLELSRTAVGLVDELVRGYPELRGRLRLKSRIRLWLMRRSVSCRTRDSHGEAKI